MLVKSFIANVNHGVEAAINKLDKQVNDFIGRSTIHSITDYSYHFTYDEGFIVRVVVYTL